MAALDGLTTGQRIERLRTARGMSRPVFAGLLGRSEGWVRAIESGRLLQPKLPMLIRIADVLQVSDLGELTGSVSIPVELFSADQHPALGLVRRAVDSAPLGPPSGPAPGLDHVAAALAAGWTARATRGDHRTALGELLPGLLASASAAATHPECPAPRRAQILYVSVLSLAQMYVSYQGDGHLLWRVVERALATARATGDPVAIAGAAWGATEALRQSGQWESAQTVTEEALRVLDPLRSNGPELAAAWAAMAWQAAATHARAGEAGDAWHWHDRAESVARTLPARWWSPQTSASVQAVAMHGVTIAVELRQTGTALRWAERLEPQAIPSRPRRARHLIEVARIHQLRRQPEQTAGLLAGAAQAASETARWNGETHAMVRELLEGPASVRRPARELAAAVGIAA